jgi:hypothetical protein
MGISTRIIIVFGCFPIVFELLLLPFALLDPGSDVGWPWFVMIVGFGLVIVAVGLLKWLLLDWLLGVRF